MELIGSFCRHSSKLKLYFIQHVNTWQVRENECNTWNGDFWLLHGNAFDVKKSKREYAKQRKRERTRIYDTKFSQHNDCC